MIDKGKPDQSLGRKAADPRFLCHAFFDATKDPKIAGLQAIPDLHRESAFSGGLAMKTRLRLGLFATLLVLPFMWATSFAREVPITISYTGALVPIPVNLSSSLTPASIVDTQSLGTFGASMSHIVTEWVEVPETNCDGHFVGVGEGDYTGRFGGGTGAFTSPSSGYNLTGFAYGYGPGPIEGTFEGTVTLQ